LLADEVDVGAVRDNAAVVAHFQELVDGFPAVSSVVERTLVDVHADEAVGEGGIEVASELHCVREGLFAVVKRVLDTVAEGIGRGAESFGAKRATDGVAAEGQWQAGLFAPPLTEVEELDEAVVGVSELAFVDDEARFELARGNGGDDLVEGDDRGFDLGCEELEGEVGGSKGAWDGDAGLLDLRQGEFAGGDDHGTVAFTDAATAGHQGVVVLQVGVGVERDGGDVVEGLIDGAVVEGFYVGEGVGEFVARDTHLVSGEAIEHEGVVGIGAMGDADLLNGGACGSHDAFNPSRRLKIVRCAEF
jgi:hypothetical protein